MITERLFRIPKISFQDERITIAAGVVYPRIISLHMIMFTVRLYWLTVPFTSPEY